MTQKTLKRIQAITTELTNIQDELLGEHEREVVPSVQAAVRELTAANVVSAIQRAELDAEAGK